MSEASDPTFAEAAPYYRFRAPYAPAALEYVRDELELDSTSRVVDLGCGPGTIAIPMSRMVGYVLAVDPCQPMIDEGRAQAATAGRDNIEWLCARAEDIGEELGPFTVAVIGQAFHWMDRDLVLRKLARMLDPERGSLALINPGKRRPQESWEAAAHEVVVRYIGTQGRHAKMNAEPEHEPALLRSGTFSQFTTREFAMEIERDIPSIIGYGYSTSTSPRSAFGERAPQFERELTEVLLSANPSGVFKERVETEVLIARRSDAIR
jgi:ubiquinone/menaquinone biosynthesis C-methylase UbiE